MYQKFAACNIKTVLMRDRWAEVRAAESEAELLLYGDIGEDWWGDESNTAKNVVETISQLAGTATSLTTRINSYGGSVSDGIAIHNAIRRFNGEKKVAIDGVAMSIASLIAMAGDTVSMSANGLVMVHAPWTIALGNAQDFRATADVLDKYSEAMVSSYERKTGRARDELLALITDGEDHYYTADEAQAFGFIDEVTDALPIAAHFDLGRFNRLPAAAAAYTQQRENPKMDDDITLAPPADAHGNPPDPSIDADLIAERARTNARIRELAAMMKNTLPGAEALAERMIALDSSEDDMKHELRKAMAAARPGPVEPTPRQPRFEQRLRYKSMLGFASEEDAYRSGMWARAIIFKDTNAERWCRDAGVRMAQTGTTGIGGGVLVPDEMSQAIIDLREQYGVARRECEVVPMNSDTLTTPRATADPEGYFEGETDTATEDETDWDNVELVARKLRTLVKIPRDLAEDAIVDLASDTSTRLARSYAKKEDDCLFNGDGSSTYGGIYGIRAKIIVGSLAGAVVALTATHDTFAEIDNDDLVAVTGALPEFAEDNAKWYCSKRANSLVFDALKAAAGGNTVTTLEGKPQRDYLGDPIVLSSKMPSGASTDYSDVVMLIYGDLRQGVKLGDRRGFSIQVLNELYAANDQIGVIGRERFDIVVHGLGDSTDAGPICALVGGAS